MHRGNNRQDIFESEEDMVWIKEDIELSKSNCSLHAYVIMRKSRGQRKVKGSEYLKEIGKAVRDRVF